MYVPQEPVSCHKRSKASGMDSTWRPIGGVKVNYTSNSEYSDTVSHLENTECISDKGTVWKVSQRCLSCLVFRVYLQTLHRRLALQSPGQAPLHYCDAVDAEVCCHTTPPTNQPQHLFLISSCVVFPCCLALSCLVLCIHNAQILSEQQNKCSNFV